MRRLKVLVWNTHGDYLHYLFQCPHDFYVISKPPIVGLRPENVHRIPARQVKELDLDLILFQLPQQFLKDQHEILSVAQKQLPKIYLEHDVPLNSVTDQRHWVDDPAMRLVHVTPFNDLLWDCGRTPTQVIDHGVLLPRDVHYAGDLAKGLVILDHLGMGGRRLGLDIYHRVRQEVPLDLIGLDTEDIEGSLTEAPPERRHGLASHYRFLFSPTRYASLDLAVCEMMMMGMPVVGLATSEMVTVVRNGISGYVHTDLHKLIQNMKELIKEPAQAHRLGRNAYRYARQRFNIKRFIKEWSRLFELMSERSSDVKNSMINVHKNR